MPNPTEVAQIVCNGQIYDAWSTIDVSDAFNEPLSSFRFTCIEPISKNSSTFTNLQLKPSDSVDIILAGNAVIKGGVITDRQASYDKDNHGVMLQGYSKFIDAVVSNVPIENSQFKNYSFEQIGKKILQPFGIPLNMVNASKDAAKKFKQVSVIPGETAWDFLDRLSRMRNIYMTSAIDGSISAGSIATNSGKNASLVEGQNILSANCTISDPAAKPLAHGLGQLGGNDQIDDNTARQSSAKVTSDYPRYRYGLVIAEVAGDADDMRIRMDREAAKISGDFVRCNIVVQGWFNTLGKLWRKEDYVVVNSPMLLMNNRTLAIQRVTYMQNEEGTKTMMELVRPQDLGGNAQGALAGLGDPTGSTSQPAAAQNPQ
jgi:prophage tail gpP-like protein